MRRHSRTSPSRACCFVVEFQGGTTGTRTVELPTKYRTTPSRQQQQQQQQSLIILSGCYNNNNNNNNNKTTDDIVLKKNQTNRTGYTTFRTFQTNRSLLQVHWNNSYCGVASSTPTLNHVLLSSNSIRSLSSSSSSSSNVANGNDNIGSTNYQNKQHGMVLNILDSIVTILRTNRIHILKHRWRYEQELSYEHRHTIGRDLYNFCTLYPKLPSLFTKHHNNNNNQIHQQTTTTNNETHQQSSSSSSTFAERQAILNYLLTQTVVIETSLVQEALDAFYHNTITTSSSTPDSNDNASTTTSTATISPTTLIKMKRVCTPLYEDLIQLLLEVTAGLGLQCLITLRYDLLLYKKYLRSKHVQKQRSAAQNDSDITSVGSSSSILDPVLLLEQLSVLDEYIQQVLTIHFAPGFLDIQRITYQQSSAATIEMIAKYEAVHPVQDLQDLRARLGEHRRVFGLFHPKLDPNYIPAVVLYVSLQTTIPSSMNQIHNQEKEWNNLAGDATSLTNPSPTVATFYSISNLQPGLSGVGLGEYLIKQSVTKLQAELPSLSTFVTLSPLPYFRKWVQNRAIQLASSVSSVLNADETPWINQNDLYELADTLQCEPNKALGYLLQVVDAEKAVTRSGAASVLSSPSPSNEEDNSVVGIRIDNKLMERILMRLAAYYITLEKYRRKPLDSVARFHLSNGAEVYRLNYAADLSRKGWSNSFGIMINYHYNLDLLRSNQDQYESSYAITIHPNVQKLLE